MKSGDPDFLRVLIMGLQDLGVLYLLPLSTTILYLLSIRCPSTTSQQHFESYSGAPEADNKQRTVSI